MVAGVASMATDCIAGPTGNLVNGSFSVLCCGVYNQKLKGSAMKITREEVEHVAGLARLNLDEAEMAAMTEQMDAILSYVDKLSELKTDGIEPTAHAVPMENAFRADLETPSIGINAALENAPAAVEGCFQVPKVIE
jgi:aspartyl-tRNA(Asn)/glutamyl-tRNA(Gln) amidotransferase subunit C